jgi:hypothetical protein
MMPADPCAKKMRHRSRSVGSTTTPQYRSWPRARPGSSYAFFGGQFEKIGGGRRASTLLYDHDLTSVLANQYGSNYNQTLDDQLGVLIYTKKIKPVV